MMPARFKVLISGGGGTLGRAFVRRATREGWPADFTIYSRDPVKHQAMAREFPACKFILGDVCDAPTTWAAITGHDVVIHAAAQKHIPEAERNPLESLAVNVQGSVNVAEACARGGVRHLFAISTDKACRPVNTYGLSKLAMERTLQSMAARWEGVLSIHLLRYGNVLGSTGSVVTEWRRMAKETGRVTATDPSMSRFWLTTEMAIDLIIAAGYQPSGTILVPLLHKLEMQMMAAYVIPGIRVSYSGLRPGEKRHEELLTPLETQFAEPLLDLGPLGCRMVRLWPVTGKPRRDSCDLRFVHAEYGWRSDEAPRIEADDFARMIEAI
jgi:UDP-N-acetylglucosamine 4,6-dehydratase